MSHQAFAITESSTNNSKAFFLFVGIDKVGGVGAISPI